VKERAAILLMAVYLFGATNACQVLKLPLLVTHYIKHKQESPFITLGSFFKMHYIDAQPFDADYAQDMQLPFKTTPDTFCLNTPSVVHVVPKIDFTAPVHKPVLQLIVNEDIPLSLSTAAIFQPPRA
jgi:hypothetical protein